MKSKEDQRNCFSFKLPSRFDKRRVKQQSKDLGEIGQKLFQLLSKETDSKFSREKALSILSKILKEYNQSSKSIEKYIQKLMHDEENHVVDLENFLTSLKDKKNTFEDKIKEKNMELERNEKKLKSLTSVKPAYLEEIEMQEEMLDKLFKIYAEKIRNLDYLENLFDEMNEEDKSKREGFSNYLEKMQNILKFKEDKMFDNHRQDIDSFGVMQNEVIEIKEEDEDDEHYNKASNLF